MSDTSQGDGWWQASDGKWYPPESRPAPPSAPPPPPAPVSDSAKSGLSGWKRWAAVGGALIVVLGIIGAATSGDDSDQSGNQDSTSEATDEANAEPEEDVGPAVVTSSSTSTTTTTTSTSTTSTTTTTTTMPPSRGTPTDPLPLGDPLLSSWTYSESGSAWTGELLALLATGPARFNDDPGACFIVLGTLTPTEVDGAVSNSFDTPSIGAIAGGNFYDDEVNECDTSAVEAAGYGWILDADVTQGTTYPFYAELFLEGDPAPELEVIVLGNPRGDDSLFFEAALTDGPPDHGATAGPGIADSRDLLPTGDDLLSAFTYEETGAAWEGEILGVIATGKARFNDDAGACFVVLGTLTPTEAEGVVSNSFDTPSIGAIAGGYYLDDEVNECDTTAVETAGYGWILDAEVTIGTKYPFYAEIFVAGSEERPLEALVLGNPRNDQSLFFDPTLSEAIPNP